MKKILIGSAALLALASACKSSKKTASTAGKTSDTAVVQIQTNIAPRDSRFQTTPNGLRYYLVEDVPGQQLAAVGDFVELHIITHIGDSVLFDSRKVNNDQPVPFQLQPPSFKGDLIEGFMLMTAGDSAVFHVPVDSLLARGAQALPWMQQGAGQIVEYNVRMVTVQTQAQRQEAAAQQAEQQKAIDDQLLQDYFKANKIKAQKTESGLYYVITKASKGVKPATGDSVSMKYTGRTLDGNAFDSNTDPKFMHVQPFWFRLGTGQVIRGWDEGVALFPKGAKGTIFIPSGMAYGAQSPSPLIPANAPLIFDIEVVDVRKGGN